MLLRQQLGRCHHGRLTTARCDADGRKDRNRRLSASDIALDQAGDVVQHRFSLIGAVLRIYSAPGAYIEFERIE